MSGLLDPLPQVLYERYPGAASAPLPPEYRPSRPEKEPLFQILQANLETFLAEPIRQGGPGYPPYVERELRRMLTCRQKARGFYRVRCPDCGYERLLGLTCSGRLCPSCSARRAADGAAHLVDRVLPQAPYRQYVLSVPYALRIHLARDPAFLSQMLGAYLKCIFAWQRHRGRVIGITDGHSGAVTFVQHFGAALNAHLHWHSLVPDGLFVLEPNDTLTFRPLPPPTQPEVDRLAQRVARRLTKIAHRYLAEKQEHYLDPDDEQATLDQALLVALRPPVRPQQTQLPNAPTRPPTPKSLCSAVDGFSLHAATRIDEHDRTGLERLCRYGLRSPVAQSRLTVLPDGKVCYQLPRPWPTANGVTELVLEPLSFLKRLVALLPRPYRHTTRYHGVFANSSKYRPLLPLPPEAPALNGPHVCTDTSQPMEPDPDVALPGNPAAVRPRRLPWASLLLRTLGVRGLQCPRCSAQMVLLSLITAPAVVRKILDHLGLPSALPPIAPAAVPAQLEVGDTTWHAVAQDCLDQPSSACGDADAQAAPRAPP